MLVISLDRLPSHGRAVAEWWVESKQRRAKPLVFVGGQPDQVAIVRSKLPGGCFCARGQLERTIARLGRAAPDR